MTKAIVVLSGGQDSTICLFDAVQRHGASNVKAITFDYGQRHKIEIESAKKVASMAGVSQEIINIPSYILRSTSPLTSNKKLDEYESFEAMEQEVGDKVEKTFVPMRNTLFLTIAANRAVEWGAELIYTGICEEDNANYPDCTEAFRHTLNNAILESLGWQCKLRITAPLMYMSKSASVCMAVELPGCVEALAYSHTSYDGVYPPTGNNHANLLRAHGFLEANKPDPLVLRAWFEGLMELPATANYDDVRNHYSQDVGIRERSWGEVIAFAL